MTDRLNWKNLEREWQIEQKMSSWLTDWTENAYNVTENVEKRDWQSELKMFRHVWKIELKSVTLDSKTEQKVADRGTAYV